MKKTLSIVLAVLIVLFMCSPVFATDVTTSTTFNVELASSVKEAKAGEEVQITISLKNFTPGKTGVNTFYFVLDYDKAVFETLAGENFTASNGWGAVTFNPATGEGVTDNSTFMAEDHEAIKVNLKVKEDANVGNTTITVRDVESSDSVNDIHPADQSISVKIVEATTEPQPNNTTNTVNTVTPEPAPSNPSTGIEDYTIPAILVVSVLAVIAYVRYRKLEK